MSGHEVARAAAMLVGAPFRPFGRDPASGLDCVGVVLVALAGAGLRVPPVPVYAMRNSAVAHLLPFAATAGLVPAADGTKAGPNAGDVLLFRVGPAQHHLAVALGPDRFVHAHAGLGRVVAQPGPLPWPALARWRPAPTIAPRED